MNNDAISVIGKSHNVCEDYSRYNYQLCLNKNKNEKPFLIVCDGCSLPKFQDRDFGARILAINAQKFLYDDDFYTKTVQQSMNDALNLGLPLTSIDATLLSAKIVDDNVVLSSFGDGVVAALRKDGILQVWNQVFDSGLPYYLSYYLNSIRKNEMLKMTDGNKRKEVYYETKVNIDKIDNDRYNWNEKYSKIEDNPFFSVSLNYKDYVWVSLISDGIHSYHKKNENQVDVSVDFTYILGCLLEYKTFAGEFVKRTVLASERFCIKNGFWHHDDITVASIYFGD